MSHEQPPDHDKLPLEESVLLSKEDSVFLAPYRCKGEKCKICTGGFHDLVIQLKQEGCTQRVIAQKISAEHGIDLNEANVSRHYSSYKSILVPLSASSEVEYKAILEKEAAFVGMARAKTLILRDAVFSSLLAQIRNGLYKPSISDYTALQTLYSKILTDPISSASGMDDQCGRIFRTAEEKFQYLFTLPQQEEQRSTGFETGENVTEAQSNTR